MDLKLYFQELKNYRYTFLLSVLGVMAVVVGYILIQPERYTTVLSLHVARTNPGSQEVSEYAYDGFYRLQADERFADTIVRWLASPRIVADIYAGTGREIATPKEHQLPNIFSARRLSSQYVEVRFTTASEDIARMLSTSLEEVLNKRTSELNAGETEGTSWFRVVVEDPVIYPYYIPWTRVLVGSGIVGALLGFWLVGMKISWKQEED